MFRTGSTGSRRHPTFSRGTCIYSTISLPPSFPHCLRSLPIDADSTGNVNQPTRRRAALQFVLLWDCPRDRILWYCMRTNVSTVVIVKCITAMNETSLLAQILLLCPVRTTFWHSFISLLFTPAIRTILCAQRPL